MRFAYFPLFKVRLRHGYYSSGASSDDFAVSPDPATGRLLQSHGLRFQAMSDGFAVFAEVDPGTLPGTTSARPGLRALDGTEVLRMHFHMRLLNPRLVNVTELPDHRPGSAVFYFNNLRQDRDDGRLHLGDSVAGARVGAPIALVTSPDYRHRFSAPVRSGTLTITDLFGAEVHVESFGYPAGVEPTREFVLDLSLIDEMVPGRYRVTDHLGGVQDLFFASESYLDRPFGVIEIFSSTVGLTPGTSKVPTEYRMFQGDEIRRVDDFHVQFEPRETTWRYTVAKKYADVASGGVDVAKLEIDGAGFTAAVDSADPPQWATLTSNAPRALSEGPSGLKLNQAPGKRIRALPGPQLHTPLEKESVNSTERIVSNLFINV